MNITQLKVLDALEREKTLTQTARVLNVSQPAVSLQLKKLRTQYGVKLYWRRGRFFEFSEFGRELVQKSRRVLGLLDDMEASLLAASGLRAGRLRIGLSCHYFVMGIVATFMERYPGLQVKARIDHSIQLLAEIQDCRLDIAEVTGTRPDPRFHNFLYSHQNIIFFAHRDHPLARHDQLHIDALHGEKMVAWHANSMTRCIFTERLALAGSHPKIVLEVDSWETMRDAVAAGIGFGAVLEEEFSGDKRLKKITLLGADMSACQYFICLPEFRDLRTVKAFFDLLDETQAG